MSDKKEITPEYVKYQVGYIEAIAGDDEAAHSNEDSLWNDVLKAIAEGAENPVELAKEALKTTQIDFCRWCA